MVRTRIRIGLALAFTASLAFSSSTASAEDEAKSKPAANEPMTEEPAANAPTLESLLERVPVLSPENEDLQSFSFKLRIGTARFQGAWTREGDQRALLVTDALSGTPVVYMNQRRLMIFDILDRRIIMVDDVRPRIDARVFDGWVNFRVGAGDPLKQSPPFEVDLPSFARALGRYFPESERQSNGLWKVAGTVGTTSAYALFDPARPAAIQSLEMVDRSRRTVDVVIEEVTLNEALVDAFPAFPAPSDLPPGLGFVRTELPGEADGGETFFAPMFTSLIAIDAIDNLQARPFLASMRVDWARIERMNADEGAQLRKLLATPAPPAANRD